MHDQDFPAAHSMDTEWFAVDAQGHVACFETHEAGALPTAAEQALAGDRIALHEAMLELTPEDGIEYYVDDLIAEPGGPFFDFSWETNKFQTAHISTFTSIFCVLMYLADARVFERAGATTSSFLARLFRSTSSLPRVARLPNSKHLLGYIDANLEPSLLENWVARGFVKRAWVNHFLEPERFGIFRYSHGEAFENWIAGPYLRDSQPVCPVKLEQLPEAMQSIFRQIHFTDIDFSRWHAVDPRAAGECTVWGDAWVALDGTVHRPEEEA